MRIHRAPGGATTSIDKEREFNWYRPGKGIRRAGPVTHLSKEDLQAFADREGLVLSDRATFAVQRHA
jgi:hypothetical protein